jgi:CubicO group peptidase (beta-lactamase class C family)
MPVRPSRRSVVAGTAALGALAGSEARAESQAPAARFQPAIDYAKSQKTTGFLVICDRKVLVEENWPAPADTLFENFVYERTSHGALLEDVASQQKSFVSVLVAVAIDKGLIDVERPVSDYIGRGWTKASPDQEAKIRVIHVLTMSSGLHEDFTYAAPSGTVFFYNTPVYATTKRLLSAVAKQPLDAITRDWLTAPADMAETAWRKRPDTPLLRAAGNPTGLVTSPRDTAKLGQMILDGGLSADGKRIVSETGVRAMFTRSPTNPAYGRLWWLNGGAFTVRPPQEHVPGQLIPAAPADLVAALGFLDRKLHVVPSLKLIVVRMGAAAPDKDFDQQLWLRLKPAMA